MNFMSWNCRGICSKGFTSLVKDIRKNYECSLIFLSETHSSGDMAQKKIKKMGFAGTFVVDSVGQGGGIWCLWDGNWKVEVLGASTQFVHLRVKWKRQSSWLLTVVYARPIYARKQQLWDELFSIAESHNDPWVVIGDFNCILSDRERKGGASEPSTRGRHGFRAMMQDCNLIDAGFQGSAFTWKKGNLFQRLDRMLMNMQWRLQFPQAAVFHLPYFKSDHRAIMMKMMRRGGNNQRRHPFRFLVAWMTHSDFPNLMEKTWNNEDRWGDQLVRFQGVVKRWNKEVFENIFTRKKR